MTEKTINILGTEYTIRISSDCEDTKLREADGYCDKTTKLIVVAQKSYDCEIADFENYQRKCLRHEIIHAFLFESGLHENWQHRQGQDETYVDWIATQFPKLAKAFAEAGCAE